MFRKALPSLKTIILLVSMAYLFGFAASKHYHKPLKGISIQISNKDHLFVNTEAVDKLLIQNDILSKNQAKTLLNLQHTESIIKKDPFVKGANIYVDIDGMLYVKILQHIPIARVFNDDVSYYLDSKGLKMPLKNNYAAKVLMVTGQINENDFSEIAILAKTISSDFMLSEEIIEIQKVKQDYFLHTKNAGYKINLGSLKHLNHKLLKFKVFYAGTKNSDITYKTINLKYENQVVAIKEM